MADLAAITRSDKRTVLKLLNHCGVPVMSTGENGRRFVYLSSICQAMPELYDSMKMTEEE